MQFTEQSLLILRMFTAHKYNTWAKKIEPFGVKKVATFSKPLCLERLKGNYHSEICSNCLQCNSHSLWKNNE